MKKLFCTIGLIIFLTGCQSKRLSYHPTSFYSDLDSRSINDDEILKAYQAQPQLKLPAKIAWYDMGTQDLAGKLMVKNKNVETNYLIPKTLIEGKRPHFYSNDYYFGSPQPVNLNIIRLLGARARCDIVILVSSTFEEHRQLNGLALLNIMIIPAFFSPYINVEYYYEAEALIFDIRNGYLYKHATTSVEEKSDYLTIYGVSEKDVEMKAKMEKDAVEYLKKEIESVIK